MGYQSTDEHSRPTVFYKGYSRTWQIGQEKAGLWSTIVLPNPYSYGRTQFSISLRRLSCHGRHNAAGATANLAGTLTVRFSHSTRRMRRTHAAYVASVPSQIRFIRNARQGFGLPAVATTMRRYVACTVSRNTRPSYSVRNTPLGIICRACFTRRDCGTLPLFRVVSCRSSWVHVRL